MTILIKNNCEILHVFYLRKTCNISGKFKLLRYLEKVGEIIQRCIISQIFALCREYEKLISIQTGKAKYSKCWALGKIMTSYQIGGGGNSEEAEEVNRRKPKGI